ncbi:hypothetical protein AB4Y86_11030 [Arthrobacter sp. 2YAF22_2]|uniref:hypothetical protein n=1 Tax=Arthrobacter sp. 2YAF22_2 TaxID=3233029 RepID=UPI003F923FA9
MIFESGLDLALLMCLWAFCGAIVVVEGWVAAAVRRHLPDFLPPIDVGLLVVEILPDRVHVWAPAE